jgi:hypothetical protein
MRRLIPIIFILLLSAPFWGTFSWLKLEKHGVRKSIKHKIIDGIDQDLLVHKSFSKKDTATLLQWKHAKEFSYDGEMYDIVSRTYTKDSVNYALWWDNEETQLNRKLDRLTNNFIEGSSESENKSNYFGFVVKHFFCNKKPSFSLTKTEELKKPYWLYLEKKTVKHTNVDLPPPKFIIQNV